MKKQSAFTLIELMVTILIVTILASIGIPSYQSFVKAEQFSTTNNAIYNAYRFARNEAIKTARSVTITAEDGDWKKGWTITNSKNTLLVGNALPDSVNVSGNSNILTVSGNGALPQGVVKFTISQDDKNNCLTILSSGQIGIDKDVKCS